MSEPIERSMLALQVCLLTTHTGTDLGRQNLTFIKSIPALQSKKVINNAVYNITDEAEKAY